MTLCRVSKIFRDTCKTNYVKAIIERKKREEIKYLYLFESDFRKVIPMFDKNLIIKQYRISQQLLVIITKEDIQEPLKYGNRLIYNNEKLLSLGSRISNKCIERAKQIKTFESSVKEKYTEYYYYCLVANEKDLPSYDECSSSMGWDLFNLNNGMKEFYACRR